MVQETRKSPTRLCFKKIPTVRHWQQLTVITMGDQAHNQRPGGYSTGGLITLLGGPEAASSSPGRMTLVAWKTWKLRRIALSSNDAEIQAMVEAEDVNYRTRLLWTEVNGAGVDRPHGDWLLHSERLVRQVTGVVATDSKGGFDAVTLQEGAYLGLSNVRAAIQAQQLKQYLSRVGTKPIWLAGDWLLADAMTKKKLESRASLIQFLKQGIWMLQYNPEFIQSAKKAKAMGKDAITRMHEITKDQGAEKVFVSVQQCHDNHFMSVM